MTVFHEARHFHVLRRAAENRVHNEAELRSGRIDMASRPNSLRVTTEVRCNIPETSQACAYCRWDYYKSLERGSRPFGLQTLEELGDFYAAASQVIDCSIAEPTMHKQFAELVSVYDRDQKEFSFTSNGQLLGQRRRGDILGKNITLYVSIDSATAEGFRRYRNDKFDEIIANLRALCQEKRAHGNLPTVWVSFIAMRSNIAELPQYFELMHDIGVDRLKFRTLEITDTKETVVNNGYRFDYRREMVDLAELDALAATIERLSDHHQLPAYIDWQDFAPADKEVATSPEAATPLPLCQEPWTSLNVFRRGIMMCCYADKPLATWDEQGERSLEDFVSDVFYGPVFQNIRSELAQGRLPQPCRNTGSCPILKRQNLDATSGPDVIPFPQSATSPTIDLPVIDAPDEPVILPLVAAESLGYWRARSA